ncbi:phenylacetate--CoA ligase family protein [Tessaracoccus sp. G1721]
MTGRVNGRSRALGTVPQDELRAAMTLWRAEQEGVSGIARRRDARVAALRTHAAQRSRFYADHWTGVPADAPLAALPPVTKGHLMSRFDEWATDPRITLAGALAFVEEPARVGTGFMGGHFVCTSSGTTGRRALFVHDRGALAVYRVLNLRAEFHWFSARQWLELVRRPRLAAVVATGGHFAAAGWIESERRRDAVRARAYRTFPVQSPLPQLVADLNSFDPGVLMCYPSALGLLAAEQEAGRLRVRPLVVVTGGESALPGLHARAESAFGCPARDLYGASECDPLAFGCAEGWLHLHADWVVLEPVDADGRPTPPGEPSHTVLLTNLANRVQPIIRYDLGDSVVARPDPCPCGCPLPAIQVSGRRDDVLRLRAPGGTLVAIAPLAIVPILDQTPGVGLAQVVQTGPAELRVRLTVEPGADPEAVWGALADRLSRLLVTLGLGGVELVHDVRPPVQPGPGGKLRHVIGMTA